MRAMVAFCGVAPNVCTAKTETLRTYSTQCICIVCSMVQCIVHSIVHCKVHCIVHTYTL